MMNEPAQNESPADQAGVAAHPSNEDPLAARLAEAEDEISKVDKALEEAVAASAEGADLDPEHHLERAKALLVDCDKASPSQNAKDAIQNINYALAACKREHA